MGVYRDKEQNFDIYEKITFPPHFYINLFSLTFISRKKNISYNLE
jgi:hypothetical protein